MFHRLLRLIRKELQVILGDRKTRMMLIMPVIMTIFFMNFQSGLVLYWLTSNVLQIGQQYLMNRMIQKKKSESNHGKPRKK